MDICTVLWWRCTQTVGCRLLAVETRLWSQTGLSGIYDRQSGVGTGFSRRTSNFPCHYHSTTGPYSFFLWSKDNGKSCRCERHEGPWRHAGGNVGAFLLVNHGSRYRQVIGFTPCAVQVLKQAFGHIWSLPSHMLCKRLIQLFGLSEGFLLMQCRKKPLRCNVHNDDNKF